MTARRVGGEVDMGGAMARQQINSSGDLGLKRRGIRRGHIDQHGRGLFGQPGQ
ncbi:MAG: hypothetical protein MO846_04015 [Candidatus Devosia symbiotica]|nr:hypothetical protein [Candidatus Devosia symbiotica]